MIGLSSKRSRWCGLMNPVQISAKNQQGLQLQTQGIVTKSVLTGRPVFKASSQVGSRSDEILAASMDGWKKHELISSTSTKVLCFPDR